MLFPSARLDQRDVSVGAGADSSKRTAPANLDRGGYRFLGALMQTFPEQLLIRRYSIQADLWGLRRELGELDRVSARAHESLRGVQRNVDGLGRLSKPAMKQSERLLAEIAYARDRGDTLQLQLKQKRDKLVKVEQELRVTYKALGQSANSPEAQFRSDATTELETESSDGFAYDVFISHASEDKPGVVNPLVEALRELELKVWYDETEIKLGDGLRSSIDRGLTSSRFGVMILSPHFFAKRKWTTYELDSLMTREIEAGKVILPLWHKVSKDEVLTYSPKLADKLALNTATMTIADIALEIAIVVNDKPTRRA